MGAVAGEVAGADTFLEPPHWTGSPAWIKGDPRHSLSWTSRLRLPSAPIPGRLENVEEEVLDNDDEGGAVWSRRSSTHLCFQAPAPGWGRPL